MLVSPWLPLFPSSSSSSGVSIGKRVDKTVTTITEYFYKFSAETTLLAFPGNELGDAVVLRSRTGHHEIVSLSKVPRTGRPLLTHRCTPQELPRPSGVTRDPLDVNLTWLLSHLSAEQRFFTFAIDRAAGSTHTPRRNADVDAALAWFYEVHSWAGLVEAYYLRTLFTVHANHGLNLDACDAGTLFVPVLPLVDGNTAAPPAIAAAAAAASSSDKGTGLISYRQLQPGGCLLPSLDVSKLLGEQRRALVEKTVELSKTFPDADSPKLISVSEARFVLAAKHLQTIALHYSDSLGELCGRWWCPVHLPIRLSRGVAAQADCGGHWQGSEPR